MGSIARLPSPISLASQCAPLVIGGVWWTQRHSVGLPSVSTSHAPVAHRLVRRHRIRPMMLVESRGLRGARAVSNRAGGGLALINSVVWLVCQASIGAMSATGAPNSGADYTLHAHVMSSGTAPLIWPLHKLGMVCLPETPSPPAARRPISVDYVNVPFPLSLSLSLWWFIANQRCH